MAINLSIRELELPSLQFGGAGGHTDPKIGLDNAGPFDLRFGAARQSRVNIGIVGPSSMIDLTRLWLKRCQNSIPVLGEQSLLRKSFPGFKNVFRAEMNFPDTWSVSFDEKSTNGLDRTLEDPDPFKRFENVVDIYAAAHSRLASREVNRPDVVILAIPDEVLKRARTVERGLSPQEKIRAKEILKSRTTGQMDMFDLLQEVEQTEDDFLKRDLRHALKARALANGLPIQIATMSLLQDGMANEDPASRAWNFCVGLYYKAGGVPWRLPSGGPETCFVGISFHHFKTVQRHIVQSTLAQAFSSEGEGFVIRGQGVPADPEQGRNLHLSEEQAFRLGASILKEYRLRTGGPPLRIVIHKTSFFDAAELSGFTATFRDIPIVELITLVPSNFRLMRFGAYPPKVGTLCSVNSARDYLFTSGFMPELGTYPGPHIPQPFEVRRIGDGNPVSAAQDVLNLTRMNWNTADIKGKWPVTLSFARRVGGILDEYSERTHQDEQATSFRYFV
ncbi:MAG: hypothetical protein AB7F94_02625 [Nitrospira sp.]